MLLITAERWRPSYGPQPHVKNTLYNLVVKKQFAKVIFLLLEFS